MPTNTTYPNAAEWTPLQAKTTNITLGSLAQKATGFAVGAIGSLSGIPQVAQIGQSFTNSSENYSPKSAYAVAALNAMKSTNNIGIQYPDFRARKFPSKEADTAGASAALSTKRVDGLAVSQRTLFDRSDAGNQEKMQFAPDYILLHLFLHMVHILYLICKHCMVGAIMIIHML
jgi:hypothetical protein